MSTAMPKANESELDKAIGDTLEKGTSAFISELLDERGKSHGKFEHHARITQRLKNVMRDELLARHKRNQIRLAHADVEALEMILHKIGRIIAGDPDFDDHWDDIAGYAKLCTSAEGHK